MTEKDLLGTTELSGAPAQIKDAVACTQAQGGKMSSQDGLVMNSDFHWKNLQDCQDMQPENRLHCVHLLYSEILQFHLLE